MSGSKELITELSRLAPLANDPVDLHGYDESSADYRLGRLHHTSLSNKDLAKLIKIMREEEWISRFEGGIANSSPDGTKSIDLSSLAQWLVAQARFREASTCVAELRAALEQRDHQIVEIVALWGISPIDVIDVGNGLSIVPIAHIPESTLKDLLLGRQRHKFSLDFPALVPRPGSALIRTFSHGPVFEDSSSRAATLSKKHVDLLLGLLTSPRSDHSRAMSEIAEHMDPLKAARESPSIRWEAEEIVRVVALACPESIHPIANWYQRPTNLPIVGQISSYSGPINEHPFSSRLDEKSYPTSQIEELVRLYRAMPLETRKRLRTSLSRLNEGRKQLSYGTLEGAAIDIGIAAEALLTQDRDRDAPISYLLRLRGTLLLGGSPEERRQTYNTLRSLYRWRSIVAHEGQIVDMASIPHSATARKRDVEARNDLNRARDVCTRMLVHIIKLGSFPSWDEVALGMIP